MYQGLHFTLHLNLRIMTCRIDLGRVRLDVEYTYYPSVAFTYDEPAEPACVEIQAILVEDSNMDIYDIVSNSVLDSIIEEIIELHS